MTSSDAQSDIGTNNPSCDSSDVSDLNVGILLDGKYQVLEELARSNVAIVYKASNPQLESLVAIKILNNVELFSEDLTERFFREIKLLSALEHRNIVKVFGAGMVGNRPFLVMEFIEGKSLDQIVSSGISTAQAMPLFIQICDGLSYIHSQGIVHRDVKPSNVMIVDRDKTTKVIDFGIAKSIKSDGLDAQKLTQAGAFVGSLAYASPEQIRSENIDERSDIYSFGCLMYEVLAGTKPFRGNSDFELSHQHLSTTPERIVHIPKGLNDIIQKAINKDANNRYQNFSAVKEALIAISDEPLENFSEPRRKLSLGLSVRLIALLSIVVVGITCAFVFFFRHRDSSLGSVGNRLAAETALKDNRPNDAIRLYQQELEQLKLTGGSPSQLFDVHEKLGAAYTRIGDLKHSTQAYQNAADDLYASFIAADKKGDQSAKRKILELTALTVKNDFPADIRSTAASKLLFELAWVKVRDGDFDLAESYFQRSLDLWKKRGVTELRERSRSMEGLAWTLIRKGRLNEAKELYLQSLATREEIQGPMSDACLRPVAFLYYINQRQKNRKVSTQLRARFESLIEFNIQQSDRNCADVLLALAELVEDKKEAATLIDRSEKIYRADPSRFRENLLQLEGIKAKNAAN